MKRLFLFQLVLALLLIASYEAKAQDCQSAAFEDLLKAKLSKGFVHKKTINLNQSSMSGGSSNFKFNFTKGSLYQIHMSNFRGEQKSVKIELYDKNGQLVASNFDENSGRYWPIGYACRFSGEYSLKVTFQNNPQSCGVFVLGERACSFCE